jgi:hypothetical protein
MCEDNIKASLEVLGWEVVDWIDLAHFGGKWRSLVNAEMNVWFHKMLELSRLAEELFASREGHRSVELVTCGGKEGLNTVTEVSCWCKSGSCNGAVCHCGDI